MSLPSAHKRADAWSRLSGAVVLVVVVLLGVAFAQAMHTGADGRWVLPLDDAYIHQQYARQLARGSFMRFNDQDPPTSGATSLLYPGVLAVAWKLGAQGDALSAVAFVLGGFCLFGAALLSARISRRLYGVWNAAAPEKAQWAGWLAALLVLSNGALLWGFFSGMETGLVILLALAALDAFLADQRRRTALWGSLLALTRPEGMFLVAILALVVMVRLWQRRDWVRPSGAWWAVVPVVCSLVQPLLNLWLTGSLAANGMRAKSWLYDVPFSPTALLHAIGGTVVAIYTTFLTGLQPEAWRSLPVSLLRSPLQIALYLPPLLGAAGLAYVLRQAWQEVRRRQVGAAVLLLLWTMVGLVSTATLITAQWHLQRYQLPFFTLGILVGATALTAWTQRVGWRALCMVSGLSLLLSVASVPGFLLRYQQATHTVLGQQIALAEWTRANLPAEARIGVHDAGAIRYYGALDTYDLVGLTSPQETARAWRQGAGSIFESLERSPDRPSFFAIYNDIWALPLLVPTDLFAKALFQVQEPDLAGVVSASDHQVVYAADWRLRDSGNVVQQQNIRQIVQGLTLRDALDVADLTDEKAHQYHWWQVGSRTGWATEVHQLTYPMPPHVQVLDGGRLLTGGESFDLATQPGQDAVLVGRFYGRGPVSLWVQVNGLPLGAWSYPAFDSAWQERAIRIPAALITSARTRIELQVDASLPGFEFHRPYHYWLYQGALAGDALAPEHVLAARLGDGILLLGYDLEHWRTGGAQGLDLTLYWKADKPIAQDYKVFVHWVDDQERKLAQQDSRPQQDQQPTWLWQPGFVITDTYQLTIPADTSPGLTSVYVGLYDDKTLARAPVEGGDASARVKLANVPLP